MDMCPHIVIPDTISPLSKRYSIASHVSLGVGTAGLFNNRARFHHIRKKTTSETAEITIFLMNL